MKTSLRRTTENDLDFVLNAEHCPENSPFVNRWTREQHAGILSSEDAAHFIIVPEPEGGRVGYVILAGLADSHQSIELRRIVVTEKNNGHGKEALSLIKQLAFAELTAQRLWLDVKEGNLRARHVYESEGFIFEGVLRECFHGENGFESLVVMSVLREEFDGPGKPTNGSWSSSKLQDSVELVRRGPPFATFTR
jgi:diamine N-acetyltransferase